MKDKAEPESRSGGADPALLPAAAIGAMLAGFRWEASRLRPDLTLEGLLAAVAGARLVKSNRRRRVYELRTGFKLAAPGYFLKIGHAEPSGGRLSGWLRRQRRDAEWDNLHRLQAMGLAACTPVLRGEKAGGRASGFFLVTEKIAGLPFGVSQGGPPPAAALGRYLAALHGRGIHAADLHPQNIIVAADGSLCLIDAQAVFFWPWLPRRLRVQSLGRLLHELIQEEEDPPAFWEALLAAYNAATGRGVTREETLSAAGRFRRRRLRSRAKRCCVESSAFEVVPGVGYRRRGFVIGPEEIDRIFENGRPLKGDHVRESQGLCVKARRRSRLRPDRSLAGWKMGHALSLRGIPVARPLAYYRRRGLSLLVCEYLADGRPLNECLSALSGRALREKLLNLARWLRKIHAAGVWQHDFKSANVLCMPQQFYLLDLEGVRLQRMTRRRIVVNLAQLNASISHAVGLKDRLRFYRYYHADDCPPRRERRADYRAVWDISRRKNTAASGLDLNRLRPGPA